VLTEVAEGVLVQESEFCRTNTVVVRGDAGVLVIDPGVHGHELAALANDLRDLRLPVEAGFSTHPHWDHLLWHEQLGRAPRYATARCAATVRARLPDAQAKARLAQWVPPDILEQISLDLLGRVIGLPAGAERIPWGGPEVRILEHQAHAPGHAALLIADRGVLVAGDMLSDVLIPLLDLNDATHPIEDHLAGLRLLEDVADGVEVFIPGHGSAGNGGEIHARIGQDRAYLHAVREGVPAEDPRIGPEAPFKWMAGVHERQVHNLGRAAERNSAPG
jgi:glyoxylase-like metal-dependent hydrolase (beta-lactamase superfamily II)